MEKWVIMGSVMVDLENIHWGVAWVIVGRRDNIYRETREC